MKTIHKMLLAICLLFVSAVAFCNTNLYTKTERQVSAARLTHAARVEIGVKWKKEEAYRVRRHRPGRFRYDTKYRTSYKNTSCVGVLLNNGYVVTSSSCIRRHSGFRVDEVVLSFSNGKTATVKGRKVRTKGEIAQIQVESSVTQGIIGMEVVSIQEGTSLQDVYGKDFAYALQQFLVSRGVVSPRAARMMGRKPNLQVGEPVFWKGKLVALFNSVPRRLPVALFGQISEDYLSVFRS